MLVSKLRSGTSKTMQLVPVHLELPLFWKFLCATCSQACVILYHVTGSCKEPIKLVPEALNNLNISWDHAPDPPTLLVTLQ